MSLGLAFLILSICGVSLGLDLLMLFIFHKIRESEHYSSDSNHFHWQYNELITEFAAAMRDKVEQEKARIELNNASIIQSKLNLRLDSQPDDYAIYGNILSAAECSGDWWYTYWRNGKINIWLGDVIGHGVAAALVASACRSLVTSFQFGNETSLQDQVGTLNNVIVDMFGADSFITFQALSITLDTGRTEFINGSHPEPLYRQESYMPVSLPMNPPLGRKKDSVFQSGYLDFSMGASLMLTTDGLLEMPVKPGVRWSAKALQMFLDGLEPEHSSEPQFVVDSVFHRIAEVALKPNEIPDDVTIIAITRKALTQSRSKAA